MLFLILPLILASVRSARDTDAPDFYKQKLG